MSKVKKIGDAEICQKDPAGRQTEQSSSITVDCRLSTVDVVTFCYIDEEGANTSFSL